MTEEFVIAFHDVFEQRDHFRIVDRGRRAIECDAVFRRTISSG